MPGRRSLPVRRPTPAGRRPSLARSRDRGRGVGWCHPVGRRGGGRGDGRGDGRGGARGVGLARSRAWGGRFGDVARGGSRVMRAMCALFGFGFGGSVTCGAAAAACHPKSASLWRRVVVSLCRRWAVSVSLARARRGGGSVASRARTMRRHPDGRADDGGAAVSPARAS